MPTTVALSCFLWFASFAMFFYSSLIFLVSLRWLSSLIIVILLSLLGNFCYFMSFAQGQTLSDSPEWTDFPVSPPPIPEEIPEIPDTIIIQSFQFEGNTAFSSEELAGVIQNYTNRPISFSELLQARFDITQYYISKGYLTSGAYIPPQAIKKGKVTIAIVEGTLSKIQVEVEGKLNPNYIRSRIAIATTPPLNVPRLLKSLQLLQLDPLIKSISADLSTGIQPGESILNVTAVTANSFHFKILLDNGRNPQVGSFRRGAEIRDDNFGGLGDSLQASYRNTDGSDDIEVSYNIPVNARNGQVDLNFRNLTGKIVEKPFNVLDLSSDYQKYALSFQQPVWQSPNKDLVLGITFDYQSNYTRTPLFPITSPGSDAAGYTRATTIRFFQEWTQREEQQVIAVRSEFNQGIDALGTTVPFDIRLNPDAPNSTAFFWRGQAQWVRSLAPEMLFILRGDLQLANSPIVPLEQFALGGLGSVIGYRQNTLLTDNGFFAEAELRIPLYTNLEQQVAFHLIPFVDFGTGWNNGDFTPSINTLASVGLGLQWRYRNAFSARLDFGIPLGRVPFEGNTWQDKGIVFTVIMGP